MPITRHWATADVRGLTQKDHPSPRDERILGELLATPLPHGPPQTAAWEICLLLDVHASIQPLSVAMLSTVDLELPATIEQPDVFVVPTGTSLHSNSDRSGGAVRADLRAVAAEFFADAACAARPSPDTLLR